MVVFSTSFLIRLLKMRLSHSVGIATKVYSPRKNKVEELSIETPDYRLPDWLDQIIIINMVVFSTSFLIRLLKMRLSHSVGVATKVYDPRRTKKRSSRLSIQTPGYQIGHQHDTRLRMY